MYYECFRSTDSHRAYIVCRWFHRTFFNVCLLGFPHSHVMQFGIQTLDATKTYWLLLWGSFRTYAHFNIVESFLPTQTSNKFINDKMRRTLSKNRTLGGRELNFWIVSMNWFCAYKYCDFCFIPIEWKLFGK